MTDSMLPIIRQMLDAESDRARAGILLTVSDQVLMKYREVFEATCRRAGFDHGVEFIAWRRAAWCAVRQPDGRLKPEFEAVREAFAAFAGGGEGA